MRDWDVGLSTGCFYRHNILDCLADIRDAGFERLEICSYPKHLDYHDPVAVHKARDALRELNLNAYSFHAPYGAHMDISSQNPSERDAAVAELEIAADAAAGLGARRFLMHPGPDKDLRLSAEDYNQRLRTAAGSVKRIARHCESLGLVPVLENMLPHLLFGRWSAFHYLFRAAGSTRIAVCLDTGHANCGGDVNRVLENLPGPIEMIHANDNFAHADDHLPPGQGNISWPALIRRLRAVAFKGLLMLELGGDTGKSRSAVLADAVRARRYLQHLMDA